MKNTGGLNDNFIRLARKYRLVRIVLTLYLTFYFTVIYFFRGISRQSRWSIAVLLSVSLLATQIGYVQAVSSTEESAKRQSTAQEIKAMRLATESVNGANGDEELGTEELGTEDTEEVIKLIPAEELALVWKLPQSPVYTDEAPLAVTELMLTNNNEDDLQNFNVSPATEVFGLSYPELEQTQLVQYLELIGYESIPAEWEELASLTEFALFLDENEQQPTEYLQSANLPSEDEPDTEETSTEEVTIVEREVELDSVVELAIPEPVEDDEDSADTTDDKSAKAEDDETNTSGKHGDADSHASDDSNASDDNNASDDGSATDDQSESVQIKWMITDTSVEEEQLIALDSIEGLHVYIERLSAQTYQLKSGGTVRILASLPAGTLAGEYTDVMRIQADNLDRVLEQQLHMVVIDRPEEDSTENPDGDTEEPTTENLDGDTEDSATEDSDGDTEEPSTENPDEDTEEPSTEEPGEDTEEPSTEESGGDTEEPETEGDTEIQAEDKTPPQIAITDQTGGYSMRDCYFGLSEIRVRLQATDLQLLEDGTAVDGSGISMIYYEYDGVETIAEVVDGAAEITFTENMAGWVNFYAVDAVGNVSAAARQYYMIEHNAPAIEYSKITSSTDDAEKLQIIIKDTKKLKSGLNELACFIDGEIYEIDSYEVIEEETLGEEFTLATSVMFEISLPEDKFLHRFLITASDFCGNYVEREFNARANGADDIISVVLPTTFTIHMNPTSDDAEGQIYSDDISIVNNSNFDVDVQVAKVETTVVDQNASKDCDLNLQVDTSAEDGEEADHVFALSKKQYDVTTFVLKTKAATADEPEDAKPEKAVEAIDNGKPTKEVVEQLLPTSQNGEAPETSLAGVKLSEEAGTEAESADKSEPVKDAANVQAISNAVVIRLKGTISEGSQDLWESGDLKVKIIFNFTKSQKTAETKED